MIYIDTSVALSAIIGEETQPGAQFWRETLVSSRLLHYEVLNRLHAHAASEMINKIEFIDLAADLLRRALAPFPIFVRTLDGLHLSTALYLKKNTDDGLRLATYDKRMLACAVELGLKIYPL